MALPCITHTKSKLPWRRAGFSALVSQHQSCSYVCLHQFLRITAAWKIGLHMYVVPVCFQSSSCHESLCWKDSAARDLQLRSHCLQIRLLLRQWLSQKHWWDKRKINGKAGKVERAEARHNTTQFWHPYYYKNHFTLQILIEVNKATNEHTDVATWKKCWTILLGVLSDCEHL